MWILKTVKLRYFAHCKTYSLPIESMIHVFLDVHMSLACKISLEPFWRSSEIIIENYYSVWREKTHKLSKLATGKIFFLHFICYYYNLLRYMFISCDNWKTLLFIKVYSYPEVLFNRHVLAFYETNDLKKIRILFFLSPQ